MISSLGSDNTPSALNVTEEYEQLARIKVCAGTWPCPTHINALAGKNPVLALCGDAGQNYDDENALNIQDKWWWLCSRHWPLVRHWWPIINDATALKKPKRGLTGKWESMGAALTAIHARAPAIRRLVTSLEHFAVGTYGIGTAKANAHRLMAWTHSARLWFKFLVAAEWYIEFIEPTFFRLKSGSQLTPGAGAHFGARRCRGSQSRRRRGRADCRSSPTAMRCAHRR